MWGALWPFTGRGTAMILAGVVILVAGVALQSPVMLIAALFLVVTPLIALVLLWMRPVVTGAGRTLSTLVVSAGSPVHVRLTFATGTMARTIPRAVRLFWSDRAASAHTRHQGELEPDACGIASARYEFTPLSRGQLDIGPLWTTAIDPLGLARRRSVAAPSTPLLVGPALSVLSEVNLPDQSGAGGRQVAAYAGDGTDDLIPRTYQRGDSRRRVHWKATAHRGELMVRQEEHEAAPTATVLLDRRTWLPPTLETLIAAAASVAAHLADSGYSVDVLDADGSTHVSRMGSDNAALLASLALCEAMDPSAEPGVVRPAEGLIVVVSAEHADTLVREVSGVGRRVLAVLTMNTDGLLHSGALTAGIDAAWREAVWNERS